MTMHVERRVIERLFGQRPKLIVGAADAERIESAVAGDLTGGVGVELLAFHPADGNTPPRLRSASGQTDELIQLPAPPSDPCMLATLSDAGRQEIASFVAWWNERGHAEPQVLDLRVDGEPGGNWQAALYRALFRLAWDDAARSDRCATEIRRELIELRREHEQARGILQCRAEEYERLRYSVCHLTTILPPGDGSFAPSGTAATALRQPLPVPAEGLAGFDLFASPQARSGPRDGYVVVTLIARETNVALAHWRIAYSQMVGGPVRCGLPVALSAPMHLLEIRVDWNTRSGEAPALALSPVGPIYEWSAVVEGRPLSAALAMSVWGALPGSPVSPATAMWGRLPQSDVDGASEYVMSHYMARAIRPLAERTCSYAHPLDDSPGFRLHPLEDEIATAVVPAACLPGTDRVAAMVQIRNVLANHPVEYAFALADPAAQLTAFPDPATRDPRILGSSGWQTVPADGLPHVITLFLDHPLTTMADIVAATRMPPGRPSANAWADWLEIRVRMQQSVSAQPVPNLEAAP